MDLILASEMSLPEPGSLEYLKALIDTDAAIARQCRDTLMTQCQAVIDAINGPETAEQIDAIAEKIKRSSDLFLFTEQRLWHSCQLIFDQFDIDIDLNLKNGLLPNPENIGHVMAVLREGTNRKGKSGREKSLSDACAIAWSMLHYWKRQSDRVFPAYQASEAPIKDHEDDDKLWDEILRDGSINYFGRIPHPTYSPRSFAEKLIESDEALIEVIAVNLELVNEKPDYDRKARNSLADLQQCISLVQSRSEAVLARS